jgi:Sec7-like guanine-nucleotide exchange factor
LFKRTNRFVNAIKTFLCNSLLSNCTSSSPQVIGLALQIFVLLVQDFKEYLKAEVEVFISSIFLRIIESEYSTYDHKLRVLEVLQLIFQDSKMQLELFVNYDCDYNATNIFSRIVTSLAKIAKVRIRKSIIIMNIIIMNIIIIIIISRHTILCYLICYLILYIIWYIIWYIIYYMVYYIIWYIECRQQRSECIETSCGRIHVIDK